MRKTAFTLLLISGIFLLGSCKKSQPAEDKSKESEDKVYEVTKLEGEMPIDANWDKPQWAAVDAVTLEYYMGEKPEHIPSTQAKMLYDDENIYIIFSVDDQYVRGVNKGYQSPVCQDSCAEFFFTPGSDIKDGYFNMEMNCIGTFLLFHQIARGQDAKPLTDEECDQVEVASSLKEVPGDEIKEPTRWTVEYKMPISILENYANVAKPAPGVVWKANFYKCADLSSHPHWLTWNLVDNPTPDFHRPEFFGEIRFK